MAVACTDVKSVIDAETKLEVVCRTSGDKCYRFIMNTTDDSVKLPQVFGGKTDILTGRTLEKETVFMPYDVALICEENK